METRTNSDYVGQAFRQFGRDAGAYIGLMVLTGLLYFVFSLIPGLGNILTTIVCGPLLAGIFIFIRLRDADERPDFAKFFGVFSNRYYLSFIAQAIFVTLITILFISFIGMLLNAAGALFCCIGLLVSIPVTYMAMYNAFMDQMASEPTL